MTHETKSSKEEIYKAYIDAIKKTGFVLENQIAEILKKDAWTVISNKYYEDDHSNTVREVDLIAYRTKKVQNFDVYTTLIISCKKSEECSWALMTRETDNKDPNVNWWPLHIWTNEPVLNHQINRKDAAKNFHTYAQNQGVARALKLPDFEVFAFQEVTKPLQSARAAKHGKAESTPKSSPRNDSPIFSSITSLIKAQAYEINSLPSRKKTPSVYQFNLITVVDTDLLRILFKNDEMTCEEISTEHYISRYIINRQESFSRIRFINGHSFQEELKDYEKIHTSNCNWLDQQCNDFYKDIFSEYRRYSVLAPEFRRQTESWFRYILKQELGFSIDSTEISFNYDKADKNLEIYVPLGDDELIELNSHQRTRENIAIKLKTIFRYTGTFIFSNEVPF